MALLLLEHGAKLDARTDGGKTPLGLAKERRRYSDVGSATAMTMLLDRAAQARASGRTSAAVVAAAGAAASAALTAVEFKSGGATSVRKPSKEAAREAVEEKRKLAIKASMVAAAVAAEQSDLGPWPLILETRSEARLARNGAAAGGACAALYVIFGGAESDAKQAGTAVAQRVRRQSFDVAHSAQRKDARLEPFAEAAAREAVLRAALSALWHWHSEADLAGPTKSDQQKVPDEQVKSDEQKVPDEQVRAHAKLQELVAGMKRRRCRADDELVEDLKKVFFGGGYHADDKLVQDLEKMFCGEGYAPLCAGQDKKRAFALQIQRRTLAAEAEAKAEAEAETKRKGQRPEAVAARQEAAAASPTQQAASTEQLNALQQQVVRANQSEAEAKLRESQQANALAEHQALLERERGRVGELEKALEQQRAAMELVKAEHVAAQAAWRAERGVDDDTDAYDFDGAGGVGE